MRIEIDIPKEFECDYGMDKLRDFFSRVLHDISKGRLCGKYEQEIAEMLQKAFVESKVAYDVEAKVAELENFEMWKELLIYDLSYREREIIEKAIEIVRGKE